MKKAFITGISGFVGSHLAEFLLKKGYSVFGTFLHKKKLENLKDIKDKIHLYRCDIRNSHGLKHILKRLKPDEIYHLAGIAFIPDSLRAPRVTYLINFWGTFNLLEAARDFCNNAKILYVGSAHEYGRISSKDLPIKEEHPLRPSSPYAASKAAGEMLAMQYFHNYGMKIFIVRSFNHIGPRQSSDFAIANFAKQIRDSENRKGRGIIKVGNLNVYRDFTDVRDVVRAYWSVMNNARPGEAYNVCSGKPIKLGWMLNELLKFSNIRFRVGVDKRVSRKSEIIKIYGSNQKLFYETGWRPVIPIDKTLQDILNWWREN